MKLSRINYSAAMFFGILAIVMYFLSGLLQVLLSTNYPELVSVVGPADPLQALVIVPIIGGIIIYIALIIVIAVYNLVAKKWPISWEMKK